MLFVSQIHRQSILLSQQILEDLAALHPPHTFLLQLSILFSQHPSTISQLPLLVRQHLQPRNDLIAAVIHRHPSLLMGPLTPDAQPLQHAFLEAGGEDVQSHHDCHLVLVFVLVVDLLQLVQVGSVVSDVPVVLLQQMG